MPARDVAPEVTGTVATATLMATYQHADGLDARRLQADAAAAEAGDAEARTRLLKALEPWEAHFDRWEYRAHRARLASARRPVRRPRSRERRRSPARRARAGPGGDDPSPTDLAAGRRP